MYDLDYITNPTNPRSMASLLDDMSPTDIEALRRELVHRLTFRSATENESLLHEMLFRESAAPNTNFAPLAVESTDDDEAAPVSVKSRPMLTEVFGSILDDTGWSLAEASKALGVSVAQVKCLWGRDAGEITLRTVVCAADALGLELDITVHKRR